MDNVCLVDTAQEFSYLLESGLHHLDWVLLNRNQLLIHASRLGCPDIIRRLLCIGASTEVIMALPTRHAKNYVHLPSKTALLATAEGRHRDCFRLVLEHCDVNKACLGLLKGQKEFSIVNCAPVGLLSQFFTIFFGIALLS